MTIANWGDKIVVTVTFFLKGYEPLLLILKIERQSSMYMRDIQRTTGEGEGEDQQAQPGIVVTITRGGYSSFRQSLPKHPLNFLNIFERLILNVICLSYKY